MLLLDEAEIAKRLSIADLIPAIEQAFRDDILVPPRTAHAVPGGKDRILLVMPAFGKAGDGVVKLVGVHPDNSVRSLPTIQGSILVFDRYGTPIALLDAATITRMRTSAASAVASKYLSRSDSSRLVVIGTGALAPAMVEAHCAVRPITTVCIWGRSRDRAFAAAQEARARIPTAVAIELVNELATEVNRADIICCCTSSTQPLLEGRWLRNGAFVDAVGSFSPKKREIDDEVISRSRIFVDTLEGGLSEAGDILQPLARKIIDRSKIEGELADLIAGRVRGRASDQEIILFKSVGTALEDHAAARAVLAAPARL